MEGKGGATMADKTSSNNAGSNRTSNKIKMPRVESARITKERIKVLESMTIDELDEKLRVETEKGRALREEIEMTRKKMEMRAIQKQKTEKAKREDPWTTEERSAWGEMSKEERPVWLAQRRKRVASQQAASNEIKGEEQVEGASTEAKKQMNSESCRKSRRSRSIEYDTLEGYDVDPSEKEFFLELLKIAPKEEVNQLVGKNKTKRKRDIEDEDVVLDTTETAVMETEGNKSKSNLMLALATATSTLAQIAGDLHAQYSRDPDKNKEREEKKKQRRMETLGSRIPIHGLPKAQADNAQYKDSDSGAMEIDYYTPKKLQSTLASAVARNDSRNKAPDNMAAAEQNVQKAKSIQEAANMLSVSVPTADLALASGARENVSMPSTTANTHMNGSHPPSTPDIQKSQISKKRKTKAAQGQTTSGYFPPPAEKKPEAQDEDGKKPGGGKQSVEQTGANEIAVKRIPKQQALGKKQKLRIQSLTEAAAQTRKISGTPGLPKPIIDLLIKTREAIEAAKSDFVAEKVMDPSAMDDCMRTVPNNAVEGRDNVGGSIPTESTKGSRKPNVKRKERKERARLQKLSRLNEPSSAPTRAVGNEEGLVVQSTDAGNPPATEISNASAPQNDSEARQSVEDTGDELGSNLLELLEKSIAPQLGTDTEATSQELKVNHL